MSLKEGSGVCMRFTSVQICVSLVLIEMWDKTILRPDPLIGYHLMVVRRVHMMQALQAKRAASDAPVG